MKKALALFFVFALVFSAGILADMDKEKGGMVKHGVMSEKADVKVVNTADGVNIMVTTKDAGEVKEIQEGAVRLAEMREKMMKGGGKEGKEDMDGTEGMGDMKGMMMHHMQKKMGIIFGFLATIWSLMIILIAVTIILVCKKIMAK
jgi:hypothetical protein